MTEKILQADTIDRILRYGAGPEFSDLYKAVEIYVNNRTRYKAPILPWEAQLITALHRCDETVQNFDRLIDKRMSNGDTKPAESTGLDRSAGLSTPRK